MQINNEEKVTALLVEIRDIMKRHDKGVRPTVILLLFLLAALVAVTYFK